MNITINKKIKALEVQSQANRFKNDEIETKVYFEEASIHKITKTQQVVVESLKLDSNVKMEKGKTYLCELTQYIVQNKQYLKIVKAEEVK
jgi:mannitol-specific phosphotransferase system IIBC component